MVPNTTGLVPGLASVGSGADYRTRTDINTLEACDPAIGRNPQGIFMNKCPVCNSDAKYVYCSLSCSSRSRRAKNAAKYNLAPKLCTCCKTPIPYGEHWVKRYCSSSCAATINNKLPNRRRKKEKVPVDRAQKKQKRLTANMQLFQLGKLKYRRDLRQCLITSNGNQCSICHLPGLWQEKPLVLVVDHIDGDAANNQPNNLRLLCPNCNSQTSTFCGRNFGKGRQARGLPKS